MTPPSRPLAVSRVFIALRDLFFGVRAGFGNPVGTTRLTLVREKVRAARVGMDVFHGARDAMRQGVTGALDGLEACLGPPSAR